MFYCISLLAIYFAMSVPSNSSHSSSQQSEPTYCRSGPPKPGDSDYGLYHRRIKEDPETIINIACRMACNKFPEIKLSNGWSLRLQMGMPANRNEYFRHFGGQVDLDVNYKRVLTVAYEPTTSEILIKNNDIHPPEILATVKVPEQIICDSPEQFQYANIVKDLIINFVRLSNNLAIAVQDAEREIFEKLKKEMM